MGAEIRRILAGSSAAQAVSSVKDEESLLAAGVIDSLTMVQLLSDLEERFGITIAEGELTPENFGSIVAIAALVYRKLGDTGRP